MRTDLQSWPVILLSLLLALVMELLPLPPLLAQLQPPWLLLVVLYWSVLQPAALGMSGAWLMGILLDVVLPAPLGTHAALFTLTVTPVLALQRLIKTLPVAQQALWIAALVSMHELGELWLGDQLISGSISAIDFLPVLSTLFAWPLILVLLFRHGKRLT